MPGKRSRGRLRKCQSRVQKHRFVQLYINAQQVCTQLGSHNRPGAQFLLARLSLFKKVSFKNWIIQAALHENIFFFFSFCKIKTSLKMGTIKIRPMYPHSHDIIQIFVYLPFVLKLTNEQIYLIVVKYFSKPFGLKIAKDLHEPIDL